MQSEHSYLWSSARTLCQEQSQVWHFTAKTVLAIINMMNKVRCQKRSSLSTGGFLGSKCRSPGWRSHPNGEISLVSWEEGHGGLWPYCFAFQRAYAERGSEGCEAIPSLGSMSGTGW